MDGIKTSDFRASRTREVGQSTHESGTGTNNGYARMQLTNPQGSDYSFGNHSLVTTTWFNEEETRVHNGRVDYDSFRSVRTVDDSYQ